MNITEQFGIGVAVMVYQHPLRQALRVLRAKIDRTGEPLAKLAGARDRLQKLHQSDTLRKSATAYLEEANAIAREALAALDDINAQLAEATAAMERMNKALPSYALWVFNGIRDPAGFDEPPPPRDPLPVLDYGHFSLTEKYIAERGGSDAKLSKLTMPQLQQRPQINPAAALDAYLARHPKRGRD